MDSLQTLKLLRDSVYDYYPKNLPEFTYFELAKSNMVETFYDYFFITFYRNQDEYKDLDRLIQNWQKYISNGNFTKSFRYKYFKNFTKNIEEHLKILEKMYETDDIKFIGDPHEDIYKAKIRDKVVYNEVLGVEDFLGELIKLFPEYRNQIFEYNKDVSGDLTFISRPYYKQLNENIDFKNYYYHFGFIIPLIASLRMIDMNWDNVLVTKESKPLLFDIEFLYVPIYRKVMDKFNIVRAGLINLRKQENISALTGPFNQGNEFLTPRLVNLDGEYVIEWIPRDKKSSVKTSMEKPHKFRSELEEGFIDGWKLIKSRLPDLKKIVYESNFNTRMIYRPSVAYRYVLMLINYLDDEVDYDTSVKILQETLHDFDDYKAKKNFEARIASHDIKVLEKLLIPYLYMSTGSNKIRDNKTGKILVEFDKTPKETMIDHLEEIEPFIKEQKRLLLWNVSMSKRL